MLPILEITNVSKIYTISSAQQSYLSLRDSIAGLFKSGGKKESFYALKDISFNVLPGETIGIIGKNGAGKSTLLKILSKITPPTSGKIISRGRIASLLEVGTGFHPELTGRENIFMNGSILGMKRSEILKNFDAIVDFSGIAKFIDTPLKHYSSGMQLRLAFAVAAFLENEILIIDEVLAVGDAEFQKKCLGKMKDVTSDGRTVLFVSHDLGAVSGLCSKGILLRNGEIIETGEMDSVIDTYISSSSQIKKYTNDENTGEIKINELAFENTSAVKGNVFRMDEDINFVLKLDNYPVPEHLALSITVSDRKESPVSTSHLELNGRNDYEIRGQIKKGSLMPGHYALHGILHIPFQRYYDKMAYSLSFEIVDSGEFANKYGQANKGSINSLIKW